MATLVRLVRFLWWCSQSKTRIVALTSGLWLAAITAGGYTGYKLEVKLSDIWTGIEIIILVSAGITILYIFLSTGHNSPLFRSRPQYGRPNVTMNPVEAAAQQWSRQEKDITVKWTPGEDFDVDALALSVLESGGFGHHNITWDVDFSAYEAHKDSPLGQWLSTKNIERLKK